jgi:hypothetical protein
MRRDYLVSPSMIGAQAGLIWSYDDPSTVTIFNESHPLAVSASRCNDSSFCLWYVSPVWSFADPSNTQYALLGNLNKWTAVSRQRFPSFSRNAEARQTTFTLLGGTIEMVEVLVYHSKLGLVHLNCSLSCAEGILTITPSTVTCTS